MYIVLDGFITFYFGSILTTCLKWSNITFLKENFLKDPKSWKELTIKLQINH